MTKLVFILMISSGTHLSCPIGGTCTVANMTQPTAEAVYDDLEECKKAGKEYTKDDLLGIRRFTCQPSQH